MENFPRQSRVRSVYWSIHMIVGVYNVRFCREIKLNIEYHYRLIYLSPTFAVTILIFAAANTLGNDTGFYQVN